MKALSLNSNFGIVTDPSDGLSVTNWISSEGKIAEQPILANKPQVRPDSILFVRASNQYLKEALVDDLRLNGDFTIELYITINSIVSINNTLVCTLTVDNNSGYQLAVLGSAYGGNSMKVRFFYYDTAQRNLVGTTVLSINTEYHIALTSKNGVLYLFVDGKLDNSAAIANPIVYSASNFGIGQAVEHIGTYGNDNATDGYINMIQINKGQARYDGLGYSNGDQVFTPRSMPTFLPPYARNADIFLTSKQGLEFDEAYPDVSDWISRTDNTKVLVQATPANQPEYIGDGVEIDATNKNLSYSLTVSAYTNLSAGLWFKPALLPSVIRTIFGYGNASFAIMYFYILADNTFEVQVRMSNGTYLLLNGGSISIDVWYYLSYHKIGEDHYFWINGTLVDSANSALAIDSTGINSLAIGNGFSANSALGVYNDAFFMEENNILNLAGVEAGDRGFSPPKRGSLENIVNQWIPQHLIDDVVLALHTKNFLTESVGAVSQWDSNFTLLSFIASGGNQPTYNSGEGINFDGTDDRLVISTESSFDIGNDDYALDLFVSPNDFNWKSGTPRAFYVQLHDSNTEIIGLYTATLTQNRNSFALRLTSSSGGTTWIESNKVDYNDNEWYHVAVVKIGDDHYLFVNGIKQAEVNQVGMNLTNHVSTSIGGNVDVNAYDGDLDGVRLVKQNIFSITGKESIGDKVFFPPVRTHKK